MVVIYINIDNRTNNRNRAKFKKILNNVNNGLVTGVHSLYEYNHILDIVKHIFEEYISSSGFDSISMKLYNEE